MTIFPTLYTLQKCKEDDTLYGPIHASDNGDETLCGLKADHNWYILNNTFTGIVTCKKCIKIITDTTLIDRAKKKKNNHDTIYGKGNI